MFLIVGKGKNHGSLVKLQQLDQKYGPWSFDLTTEIWLTGLLANQTSTLILSVKLVILSDLHMPLTISRQAVKTVGVATVAVSGGHLEQ